MSDDTIDSNVAVMERPRQHRENRKKNIGRKVAPNQAFAVVKFIRVPPRKARLVINEVRGKYTNDALAFLRFIPNRAAGYISKVLYSAVANAANNHGLNPDNLKLVEARVDEGPRMKRVQPRAQGRAYRILKRMSHITVVVEEVGPKPRKPKKAGRRNQQPGRQQQAAPMTTAAPVSIAEDTEITTPVTAVEDTASAAVAAEATTPVTPTTETTTSASEATAAPEATPATADVPEGPQTANPAATDEIGAPTTPDAVEPTIASTDGDVTGDTQAETANTQDKTDEIGAPTE